MNSPSALALLTAQREENCVRIDRMREREKKSIKREKERNLRKQKKEKKI
jgi:hypothetical protein